MCSATTIALLFVPCRDHPVDAGLSEGEHSALRAPHRERSPEAPPARSPAPAPPEASLPVVLAKARPFLSVHSSRSEATLQSPIAGTGRRRQPRPSRRGHPPVLRMRRGQHGAGAAAPEQGGESGRGAPMHLQNRNPSRFIPVCDCSEPFSRRLPHLPSSSFSSVSSVSPQAYYDGATALMKVCDRGLLEAAMLLVDKGADVNRATSDGTTPLYSAIQKGVLAAGAAFGAASGPRDQAGGGEARYCLSHMHSCSLTLLRLAWPAVAPRVPPPGETPPEDGRKRQVLPPGGRVRPRPHPHQSPATAAFCCNSPSVSPPLPTSDSVSIPPPFPASWTPNQRVDAPLCMRVQRRLGHPRAAPREWSRPKLRPS